MQFETLKTLPGLEKLNDYLSTRSYISGFQPSQNDLKVIQILSNNDDNIRTQSLSHINRWSLHIRSFSTSERNAFPTSNDPIKIIEHENTKHLPPSLESDKSNRPMNKTLLLYFQQSPDLECKATVQSVSLEENCKETNTYSIVVDQTVCHPQGGGQPFDTGFVYGNDSAVFQINDARMDRDTECIRHIGNFINGHFKIGDEVKIEIDKDKRLLYCRLHTAGHLIDAALHLIGYDWEPTKGYHFPNGPYVEYKGCLDQSEMELLKSKL